MLSHFTPALVRPPFARYSHGVSVGAGARILFCSGQLGIGLDDIVPEDATAQTMLCFDNIRAVLDEAGMSAADVVRLNAYVIDRACLADYMAARDAFIETVDPPPAPALGAGSQLQWPHPQARVRWMSETSDPLEWYRRMQRLRRFEARAAALVEAGEIVGAVHEYTGEEAVAVGVCAALRDSDVITSTHRGHGHILAKGGEPRRMFAELLGRESGYNRGRGGSMHIADFSLGIYGANGIVGAGAPMACGAAHAFRLRNEARVAVPFFGDGAMNQGVLLESFNLAVLLCLPVVFVCENNGLAVTSPTDEMTPGGIEPRAAGFGLPACSVDGMDVRAVHETATAAVERARAGGGPSFVECRTVRYSVHNIATGVPPREMRSAAFLETARGRDPIERLAGELDRERLWAQGERVGIDEEIEQELEAAVGFAREGHRPVPDSALDFMYAATYPDFPARGWEP